MGTNAQYAYIALDRAIQDAGLKPEDYENNERCASILGQGGTSIPDVTESCGYVADQAREGHVRDIYPIVMYIVVVRYICGTFYIV